MPTNQFLATHVEANAHSSEIFSIAVTPTRAVTASGDSAIKVWDVRAQEHPLVHSFDNAHRLGAHHVVVNIEQGPAIAASSGFGQELVSWDLEKGKEIMRQTASDSSENSTIDGSSDTSSFDPADSPGTDNSKRRDIVGEIWALSLSPDGSMVYSTTYDGRVVVWDSSSLKKIGEMDTKGSFGLAVACSGDGRYIASGHQNGGIYVFSVDAGRILYTLPGHSEPVRSLSFSPGSNYLAATGDSKVISVYDVRHGEQIGNLSGHSSSILSVDWNRTGQLLLTSAMDGRVKVWDFEQKACVATQTETTKTVWSAKWQRATDGFITGGADNSLYWYIAAGV